jgi:HK97 family phage major capsid protein
MSNKIAELSSKRNKLIADAQVLVNAGKANSAEYRAITTELDVIQSDIDALNFIEARMPKSPAPVAGPTPIAAPAVITQRDSAEHRAKINAATRQFFKHGVAGLPREQRDLLTTSDASGGALVSQAFDSVFIEATKHFGPIFDLVHRRDATAGEPTKFVVSDFTNQTFSVIGEGSGSVVATAQQPTLFSDITKTSTLVSSIVYSIQELEDGYDLEAFLRRNAAPAVSRAWETAITLSTSNDGTSTALTASPSGGLAGFIGTGATTAALSAGIGYDDLVNLVSSLDYSYFQAPDSAFMVSPTTWFYLASLKNSTGQNYFYVDPNTGTLSVLGKPVWVNAAMPNYNTA